MNISIDKSIKEKTNDFHIGVLICNVKIYENEYLNEIVSNYERKIQETISIKEVIKLNKIKDARDAYKSYGKDPSRYRLAAESLYRRLSKGNKLYRINNVVDIGNILSLKYQKSIAVLDYDNIQGNIKIRLGKSSDEYFGIGRGKINIENIPLYEDDLGPFGSTTSDTERTMITNGTSKILLFIVSFSGYDDLTNELEYTQELYTKYAEGSNFIRYVV